jgi:hypothetical protein
MSFQLSNLPVLARSTARRYISSLRLRIKHPREISGIQSRQLVVKLSLWAAENARKYPDNVKSLCGDSAATILRHFGFSLFYLRRRRA